MGLSYRTLQGHLEMGQMDYEVWNWLDSGDVQFRIHVESRPARIPNPLTRLGFRIFGRRQQVRFARRACERDGVPARGPPGAAGRGRAGGTQRRRPPPSLIASTIGTRRWASGASTR
jgi:hypothetical protein